MRKLFVSAVSMLVLIMLILSGCGTEAPRIEAAPKAPATKLAYGMDGVLLPGGLSSVTHFTNVGDDIAFLGESASDGSVLPYIMDTDGEIAAMPQYAADEGYNAAAMCANSEAVWVIETKYNDPGDEPDNEFSVMLRYLGSDGAEQSALDISNALIYKDTLSISAIAADDDGRIYVLDSVSGVTVINGQGERAAYIEASMFNIPISIFRHADGGVYALIIVDLAPQIARINPDTNSYAQGVKLSETVSCAYSVNGVFDYICTDSVSLYGYLSSATESNKLLDWFAVGINPDRITSVTAVGWTVYCTWTDAAGYAEMAKLTMREVPVGNEKIVLTLAMFGANGNVRGQVSLFNASNATYEIELIQYESGFSMSSLSDDPDLLREFNTAVVSGKGPDILLVPSSFQFDIYMEKGMFTDLYPYLDNDAALGGRDAIVPEILKALEAQDGSLYRICDSFTINSTAGNRDVVGDRADWTTSNVLDKLDSMPSDAKFIPSLGAGWVLEMFLQADLDSYIDWETGECRFDSENFIRVLEVAGRQANIKRPTYEESMNDTSGANDFELIREGKMLAGVAFMNNYLYYAMHKDMYGEDFAFVGFPSENGGVNAFSTFNTLAISEKCEHKDAAWELVRRFLTEEYQSRDFINSSSFFPTNAKSLDKMKQIAMTPRMGLDENGEEIELSRMDGFPHEAAVYSMTQEEIDIISDLIANTTRIKKDDIFLNAIILEEAQAYFGGVRSAEEAAKLIQGRAQIYISEQG